MYDMLQEFGGKIPPTDQVVLDDTKEVSHPSPTHGRHR